MADFKLAFDRAIKAEGGYVLHKVEHDTGGATYAGIARNKNPQWPGWRWIDRGESPPDHLVSDFYRAGWWDPVRGDEIQSQDVAYSIYSFATNAGLKTSVRLAQAVVEVNPDGAVGSKTVEAINEMEPRLFLALFALARISRYEQIVSRDRTQGKFLLGWVRRTLKESA